MKHSSKNGFIFNGRTQQQRGNNIKYVPFILMIVALITFVVSCSPPPITTDEFIVVLKVVPKEDGLVKVATSINYQGEEWLEDIDLNMAEYTRYENLPKLPVRIRFSYRGLGSSEINIFLNGKKIKTLYLSKELTDELKKRMKDKRKASISCSPTEGPTG